MIEATAAAVARMNRYPDIANSEMTHALSSRLGVAEEQLAFATGSVAVLYHLLQAMQERAMRWSASAQLRGLSDRGTAHGRDIGAGAAWSRCRS